MKIYEEKPRGVNFFSSEWTHLAIEKEKCYMYIFVCDTLRMLLLSPGMKTFRPGFAILQSTKGFFLWWTDHTTIAQPYCTPCPGARNNSSQNTSCTDPRQEQQVLQLTLIIQAGQRTWRWGWPNTLLSSSPGVVLYNSVTHFTQQPKPNQAASSSDSWHNIEAHGPMLKSHPLCNFVG